MKQLTFIIIFLLAISSASAITTYNTTGGANNQYQTGTGIFNEDLPASAIQARGIGTQRSIPYVADLNNDGLHEIIIAAGTGITLYQNHTLTVIDSHSFGTNEPLSNMDIFDIDGDGLHEIIVARETSETIEILEYNGTDFFNQSSLDLSSISHSDGGMMLKCGKTNNCLLAYHPSNTPNPDLYVTGFNSTDIGSQLTLLSDTSPTDNICFPKIRSMSYADFDGDTTDEYIFSAIRADTGSNEKIHVEVISLSDDLTANRDTFTEISGIGLGRNVNPITSATAATCNALRTEGTAEFFIEDVFTSPLIANLDGAIGNGLEMVIGAMVDEDSYAMGYYDSSFSLIDDFPEIFNAEGQILSNPMLGNIFGDSDPNNDFCIVGHDEDNEELELLCASSSTSHSQGNAQFKFETDGLYNYSKEFRNLAIISHLGQHSDRDIDLGEGEIDPTELITSYGVFRISSDVFSNILGEEVLVLNQIFDNPVGIETSCIAVDPEKSGAEDLICSETNTIYYIDDTLVNEPGIVANVTFNPCNTDVIQINTTFQISVIVQDQNLLDKDLVSSKVTIYEGSDNELINEVGNVTSGAVQPHSFTVNKSGNGQIRIEGYDQANPEDRDVETFSFTVADQGLEFGESSCSISFIVDEIPVDGILTDVEGNQLTNNSINRGIVEYSNLIGVSGTIVWLLLMLFLGASIVLTPEILRLRGVQVSINFTVLAGITFFFEGLMIVIGARLGLIGVGTVIVLSVLLLTGVGIWVSRLFTNNQTVM
ncbi:MAG: hypothetical protein GTO02_13545 [Candidatus Dadabacteria bacterium]|nr:hypothetical protein [Candidatus Dadabacteria bacterium]